MHRYLETGFSSIEGPNIKVTEMKPVFFGRDALRLQGLTDPSAFHAKEMEQRKVVVMQQMNHVLAQKSMDGFFVAACDCGVNHRCVPQVVHAAHCRSCLRVTSGCSLTGTVRMARNTTSTTIYWYV